jgi:anti-sigma factor ChrR (cupin superfamily)
VSDEKPASAATHLLLALDPARLRERDDFAPLRPGVDIAYLYRDEAGGSSAALLRYSPGAKVPRHEHAGHEHILVLDGSQRDERGEYFPGSLIINPPGTAHSVESPNGCLVLIIWSRPIHFLGEAD